MFERLEMAPPDPILGLTDAFKKDARADKINLGVGVYKDAQDRTPVLECVKKAEERLLKQESSKSYLPIPGAPEYGALVRAMVFGADHAILKSTRAATAHTPGGTGALRVAGDFIRRMLKGAVIWVSNPTWENHRGVFSSAGLEIKTYPYYDAEKKCLDFEAMMTTLHTVPEGDAVLFHACCHNPSGMDPDLKQWAAIAECLRERKALPVLDFAYQGFGDGLEEDASGLRLFCTPGCELLVCSSFSKNFGLYNERCGAITLVGADAESTDKAFSQMKLCIRQNYSNPPAHGGAIITTILNDPELRALWEKELKNMRDRINGMRHLFVNTLKDKGATRDFSFITRQKGMFSFSGLTKEQVATLREKYGIFAVASGRINVAGMTENNMDRLCAAIVDILAA